MRSPARLSHRVLAVVALASCAGAGSAASGAGPPPTLSQRAERLQHADSALAARDGDELLSLYAFDSAIARATARIDALRTEQSRVEQERLSTRRRLAAARTTFRIAQRQLALRLHALYVARPTDALAVVLGASSIEGALGQLDSLNRAAALDEQVAATALRARSRLRSLADRLSRRDAELRRLVAAAENVRATLQMERERRSRLVADLTRRHELNNAELTRVDSPARSLAGAAPDADAVDSTASAARTLVVVATGYAATGATASGVPAGPGVVAVDPSVIPLGTRLTIPGYGEGVAADTGTAVQGAVIDVWFATDAEARAWGRRTVAVVLH